MCINHTGIRSGEWITGIRAASNTTMQVFFPDGNEYHPHGSYVESMSELDLRDKLNNIPFFASMSTEDRKRHLFSHVDTFAPEHSQANNGYLSEIPGVMIRLVSIGGDFIKDGGGHIYNHLMNGELHPLSELYHLVPGGEKTRLLQQNEDSPHHHANKKHTLIFRGSLWKIKTAPPRQTPEVTFPLIPSSFSPLASPSRTYQCEMGRFNEDKKNPIYVVDVTDNSSSRPFRKENWIALINYEPSLAHVVPYFETIHNQLAWFSPGLLKSILQKLIRTRCLHVRLFSITGERPCVPASAVFFVAFILLVTHRGSFVPDIGRFVKGSESAFKRIGVAVAEDAHGSPEFIISMLAAALVAQSHPDFVPSEEFVAYAIAQSIEAQSSPVAWVYDPHLHPTIVPSHPVWKYPFLLLSTLRSFHTDIGLMQYIGRHPNNVTRQKEDLPRITMDIEYCLDQHTYTYIAHFFPPSKNDSFAPLFRHLFEHGTGRNARKMIDLAVPPPIALAQRLLWFSRSPHERSPYPMSMHHQEITFELDTSWLAGMLEKMEIKVDKQTVHVFLHPEQEGRFIAIRPASRDRAIEELTEETKEEAIRLAKEELRDKGKRVNNRMIGVSGMARIVSIVDEITGIASDMFMVDNMSWEDIRRNQLRVPVADSCLSTMDVFDDANFEQTCLLVFRHKFSPDHRGALIANWETSLHHLLTNTHPDWKDCLSRITMYLRPMKSSIDMYRISRDGTSTYLSTSWKDTVVFRFLLLLSLIAPGVIYPDTSCTFHIHDYRVWTTIKKIILDASHKNQETEVSWPVQFRDDRVLYDHQNAALEQMIHRKRRGHLIWIPVGLGKTLIVSSYIGWLIQEKKMPKYCVYTLPPSAISSIQQELMRGNLPVHLVEYNSKNKDGPSLFRPYCINLIKHDNMRVASDHLLQMAPECFFIVDEFHLTMNDTKRTSIALEMAKLAYNFIGLTGTLIKDKGSKGVIEWVNQVVDFEVTDRNYWVAVASLISRKIALKIRQDRVFHEIVMLAEEKQEYHSHVERKFGGMASTSNFSKAIKICYSVIERGITEITLDLVNAQKPIFVVAKDVAMQERLAQSFERYHHPHFGHPLRVYMISSRNSICLTPNDDKIYDIIITTCTHSTGFTLTQADTMVTAIYFSNQATRDQLDGRILRVGQVSEKVTVHILHTGILSYTKNHYEDARSLRISMQDLSESVSFSSEY